MSNIIDPVQSTHESHDGSLTVYSEKYKAHYHSIFGAIEESSHVFMSAGLFHLIRKGMSSIKIFEMGLGTALNAYLSYIESQKYNVQIHYTSIELDPVNKEIYNSLNYPEQLKRDDHDIFFKFHNSEWDTNHSINSHFNFFKILGNLETVSLQKGYNLIFYDAFAPSCQSHLWEEPIHKKIFNALDPGGCLVTYCTKGTFKRLLIELGYELEILNGPAKKREMLRATKPSKP